ncbi:MAG: hypothetical protein IT371_07990 [Deltaproteobacteria bacterium]|nr:hypothetical protein [Deltaproteobacteria bacterium]
MTRRLLLALLPLACSSGPGQIPSPLVRVDLKDQVPPEHRRRMISAIALDCEVHATLGAAGLSQQVTARYRVMDVKGSRFIVAVEVVPEGTAAPGATASAAVQTPTNTGSAAAIRMTVPVQVAWSAEKGCSRVSATQLLTLRPDDPSCKEPPSPNLLRPVK